MSPLELLLWALAGFGVLMLIVAVGLVAILVIGAVVGLRRMREDEDKSETTIFRGGAK